MISICEKAKATVKSHYNDPAIPPLSITNMSPDYLFKYSQVYIYTTIPSPIVFQYIR